MHEQKFHRSHGEEKALKVTHEDRMVDEVVGELCSEEEEAEEEVPNFSTKPLLSVTNAISLDTINMSVQCCKSRPIMRR